MAASSDQNLFEVHLNRPAPAYGKSRVRIVCISDTHNKFYADKLPDGDILLHCGDWTNKGRSFEVEEFNRQLGKVQMPHRVVISGNHEDQLNADYSPEQIRAHVLTNATQYLHHESVEVMGIRIFGSPHTAQGPSQQLKVELGEAMAAKWREIPHDSDIVMTHIPCLGIMDLAWGTADGSFPDTAGHDKPPPPPDEWNVPDEVVHGSERNSLMASIRARAPKKPAPATCAICKVPHKDNSHWGCDELLFRLSGVRLQHPRLAEKSAISSSAHLHFDSPVDPSLPPVMPKVHVCGHVHEHRGVQFANGIWHVNAAMDMNPVPIVFDVVFQPSQ